MKLRIVYYAIHGKNSYFLDKHLNEFKNDISKNIRDFSKLDIINGEEKYRDTYCFINHIIEKMIQDSKIFFQHLTDILRSASSDNFQRIKDNLPNVYEFFEHNKHADKNKISESLRFKTLICVEGENLSINENADAHGYAEGNGRYAVLVKSYKNIIWHEVAHLFGADDHYIENDVCKMKEKCANKELCVMQYDPRDKPCSFCSTAIMEMRTACIKIF